MEARTPAPGSRRTTSTGRLFARAERGDARAMARAVARCLPDLQRWTHRRLPRWVRSAADTSDLIQDAILRTLSRLDAFQPQGQRALAAYLRTAVRNRIADEHRRAGRWLAASGPMDAMESPAASPLDGAIAGETEGRYRRALAQLSDRDRELIVAHFEMDFTHAQLGCLLGRTSHAARMALTRAIARLAARMRD